MHNSDSFACLEELITNNLDLHKNSIPPDINISTMTLEAKFDTTFRPMSIYLYIIRSHDGIIKITAKKNNGSKRIKKKSEFLNQVTALVYSSKKRNKMPISIKIFRNGTLHFTGCQNIYDMLEVAHKICSECSKTRAIITKKGLLREIKFADDPSKLSVDKLKCCKIDMINSNFTVPFKINRPKLYQQLINDNYNAFYDSNKHAGVNITYKRGVTIFVFESGSIIIIVGNSGFMPIIDGYNFIYKYLLENYETIVKDDNTFLFKLLDRLI